MISSSPGINFEASPSKRRRVGAKSLVTVRIETTSTGKPTDLWSWRKYGQKSIKGSPYPRCGTSKGCSARKQVERSRTDASVHIITYTSGHSHPSPKSPSATATARPLPQCEYTEEVCDTKHSKSLNNLQEQEAKTSDFMAPLTSSSPCGENDFFDELEELPTLASPVTASRIGNFFDERFGLGLNLLP